jgi:hypothetical protein
MIPRATEKKGRKIRAKCTDAAQKLRCRSDKSRPLVPKNFALVGKSRRQGLRL